MNPLTPMPLEPPDTFHLDAARGWLGSGDPVSAAAELEHITPKLRVYPAVLHVRCDVYDRTREWDALIAVSETLIKLAPADPQGWVHRSFALHGLKHTQEAFDQLLPAAGQFPKHWLIPYNLPCSLQPATPRRARPKKVQKGAKSGLPTHRQAKQTP